MNAVIINPSNNGRIRMNMPSFWMLQLYSLGIDMFHDGPQHQATGAKTRNPTPKTRKTRNHPRGEVSRNNFDSRCCWIFTQDVLAIEDRRGGLYPIPLTLGFFVFPDDQFPCCSFHFHVWVIFGWSYHHVYHFSVGTVQQPSISVA